MLAGSRATYNCPSSLYDCQSLELSLRSTADMFITPEFMASYHDDTYVSEICRSACCLLVLVNLVNQLMHLFIYFITVIMSAHLQQFADRLNFFLELHVDLYHHRPTCLHRDRARDAGIIFSGEKNDNKY